MVVPAAGSVGLGRARAAGLGRVAQAGSLYKRGGAALLVDMGREAACPSRVNSHAAVHLAAQARWAGRQAVWREEEEGEQRQQALVAVVKAVGSCDWPAPGGGSRRR